MRGGIPLTFERRRTSKDRLKIKWDFPASIESAPKGDGKTAAQARMYAVDLKEAFRRLSGDDQRPLLVVRECGRCKGTDDALLSRSLDNEKTLVMTRWFHCVKLMHHVVDDTHTYGKLFEGPRPPHLFLASADGSNMTPLPGNQSQSDLWKAMEKALQREYEGSSKHATKEIFKVLATYDHLDAMQDQLREQYDAELEKRGPKSPKLRRIDAKLKTLAKKREQAEDREAKLSDLLLKKTIAKATR